MYDKDTLGDEKWTAIRHFFNEVVKASLDQDSQRHNNAIDELQKELSQDELAWVQSVGTDNFIDVFGDDVFDEKLKKHMEAEDDIAKQYNWPEPYRGLYPKP